MLKKSDPYFREGTMDRDIFETVYDHNEYRLPDRIASDAVIIDIGAHIGGVSYACLKRGATHIYAYEASEENHKIAAMNLEDGIKKHYVTLYNLAVWRSDCRIDEVPFTKTSDPTNTGGDSMVWDTHDRFVKVIPLDAIIDAIGRITLLKMDCEGAEYPILLTSQRFSLIDYICGEYHNTNVGAVASVNGKNSFSWLDLEALFQKSGYACVFFKQNEHVGTFFAEKVGKRPFFKM